MTPVPDESRGAAVTGPTPPAWRGDLHGFFDAVTGRLALGRERYGDRSFSLPVERLLQEVEEELLDQAAWAFIAWRRLRAARGALDLVGPGSFDQAR